MALAFPALAPGTNLASKASAHIPAARGAEAEVPVCLSVHFPLRSVVTTLLSPTPPLL